MKKQVDSKNTAQKNVTAHQGDGWFYALIAAFAFLLYANSIGNFYSLDDNLVTNRNPLIQKGIKALPEIFTTNYVTDGSVKFEYRPIVKATYAIEYQFFKANPHVSHFFNVLIYAVTCLLLYKLLRRCLPNQNRWLPLLATILFAAHPVHTEVVNNLKSRDELLALLFGLLSGLYLLRYANEATVKYLAIGVGLFILALMSKASSVCFIGILPITIYYFTQKRKEALIGVGLFVAVTAIFYGLLFTLLPGMNREPLFLENPLVEEESFAVHISSGFYWMSHYVRLLFVPYPLAFYYGYNQLPVVGFSDQLGVIAIISMLLHLSLFGYALYTLKKPNVLGYAAWVYLAGIFLFSNILVPVVGIVGERFIYIPSIGFCLALAYGLLRLAKIETDSAVLLKGNTLLYGAALVFIIPYSVITVNRNTDWKDALTLFRHDVKVVKNSAKAQSELALELRRQYKKLPQNNPKRTKLVDEALTHFAASLAIYPNRAENNNYYGSILLFEKRNPEKALVPLQKAVKLTTKTPVKYWMDLANCYMVLRQLDSAEVYFFKVLERDTMHIQAHYQLAKNAYLKGDTASAKNINRRFLKLWPDNPLPYRNQGDFYLIEGDTAKAQFWYEKERYYQQRIQPTQQKDDE